MSRRWHTVYPGRFVRTTLLSHKFPVGDPRCWFCLNATAGPWWFQIDTHRVICTRCLPDPWTETPRRSGIRAGEIAARRLATLERPGEDDEA